MKVLYGEGQRVPIKMWLDDAEDTALQQAVNLSKLPFAYHHVALMPDCHMGYGMPIGGVLATRGVVVPNAVGVDIGCGMCAVKTNLSDISTDDLKKAMGVIRQTVPVGFSKHQTPRDQSVMPIDHSPGSVVAREYANAKLSIGTLGGGNHFIEIQKDAMGGLWVMIHSGSRNLGKQVADHYNKLAVAINERWFSTVPKDWELAFLPLDSDEGQAYIHEMAYCVEFALANRTQMMDRVLEALGATSGEFINIAHNYAAMENHFGANVMVHRKGATLASEKTVGIIPGSQGTKSYIVRGKGSAESFNSCSHGAGRKLGRKAAQRELTVDGEVAKLNAQGIIHSIRNEKDLDEAPGAYKDIQAVMANQTDLVEILVELTPLAVVKG